MEKHDFRRCKLLANALTLFIASLLLAPAQAAKLPKNLKPIAYAGIDQVAGLAQSVSLRGKQSYDPDLDGAVVAYKWSRVKGPKVTIVNPTSPIASFITPASLKKNKPVDLVLKLTVTDNRKGKGNDTVIIHVSPQPCTAPQQLINGACVILASGKLNDTGITACADDTSNGLACPVVGFLSQDADAGRDATDNDDSDGHAGFSFTKLDNNGDPLPADATQWSCVKDNVTDLIWEVKTDDGGLRDQNHTYTWYEPDDRKNGGMAGTSNGGSCIVSNFDCDTYNYVQAVNAQGLCGAGDWRMPTVDELSSIAALDRVSSAIDTTWFPNTPTNWFWSSTPGTFNGFAWTVNFSNGSEAWTQEREPGRVRLVRVGQ